MWFLSGVEKGMYLEDQEDHVSGIHPDVLNQYYGIDGHPICWHEGQTGASQPPDEDAEARIAEDIQGNIQHKAVDVSSPTNPFGSSDIEALFDEALLAVNDSGIIPGGLMVSVNEWLDDSYLTHERIMTGTRSGKRLLIALPPAIWEPRALLWAQGLWVMEQFIIDIE